MFFLKVWLHECLCNLLECKFLIFVHFAWISYFEFSQFALWNFVEFAGVPISSFRHFSTFFLSFGFEFSIFFSQSDYVLKILCNLLNTAFAFLALIWLKFLFQSFSQSLLVWNFVWNTDFAFSTFCTICWNFDFNCSFRNLHVFERLWILLRCRWYRCTKSWSLTSWFLLRVAAFFQNYLFCCQQKFLVSPVARV